MTTIQNAKVVWIIIISTVLSIFLLSFTPSFINRLMKPLIESDGTDERNLKKESPHKWRISSAISELFSTTNSCDYPYVYNKPPKTASSFIHDVIERWAQETGRTSYFCSPQPLITNVILQECLPRESDVCGVFNCHVFLDNNAKKTLSERLPNYKLITSTRNGANRIVSSYLQAHEIRIQNEATNKTKVIEDFRATLSNYNPWSLYNYHTGENRSGSCSLTYNERAIIFGMAARYDIVIDANLKNASNTILKHFGLFQLPENGERVKDRGAYLLQLPDNVKRELRAVSCVDDALHKALQYRMASLLEQATDEKCVFPKKTCLGEMDDKIRYKNYY